MRGKATSFFGNQVREIFYQQPSRRAAVAALTKLGCTVLGRGTFSTVLSHPTSPKRVIKVAEVSSKRGRRWHLKDKSYYYMELCQGSCSVHSLRVYGMYTDRPDDYYIYEVERLESIVKTNISRTFTSFSKCPAEAGNALKLGDNFIYFAHVVTAYAISHRLIVDCHGENIMKRTDGTVVITDPFISR